MKAKVYSFLFVVVLLLVALWLSRKANSGDDKPGASEGANSGRSAGRNAGFDRKVSYLRYTAHARCRMKCREITQAEVQDIMKNGKINYRKSDLKDRPCATYALEGYTRQDNQHVRIVFAQCERVTRVVTCIDLDKEFACDCN